MSTTRERRRAADVPQAGQRDVLEAFGKFDIERGEQVLVQVPASS
jgi:hypothetical protein